VVTERLTEGLWLQDDLSGHPLERRFAERGNGILYPTPSFSTWAAKMVRGKIIEARLTCAGVSNDFCDADLGRIEFQSRLESLERRAPCDHNGNEAQPIFN
jgi:hypothetical protein